MGVPLGARLAIRALRVRVYGKVLCVLCVRWGRSRLKERDNLKQQAGKERG